MTVTMGLDMLKILILFLSVCTGNEVTIEISPIDGPISILPGETLKLNCTVKLPESSNTRNLDYAQWLSWKYAQNNETTDLDSVNLDGMTRSLVIDHISSNQTGTYLCYNSSVFTGHYRRVKVGYPPSAPYDFRCVSNDYIDMICHWKTAPPDPYIPEQWMLYYRAGLKNLECNASGQSEMFDGYVLQGCSISNEYSSWMGRTISFNLIVGKNEFGSVTLPLSTSVMAKNIVKISNLIPAESGVVSHVSSTSLKLSWKLPAAASMLEMFPLLYEIHIVYKINYQSKWDNEVKQVTTLDTLMTTLTSLVPNTEYSISVTAKTDNSPNTYWSDPLLVTATTSPAVPCTLPDFTMSSFHFSQQKNTIKLYLKPLSEKHQNSPWIQYNLTFEKLGENGAVLATASKQFPNNVTLNTNVSLDTDHRYRVIVQAYNEVGAAEGAKWLHLPATINTYPKPKYVIVERDPQHKRYLVSWLPPNDWKNFNITTVTYYWCLKGTKGNEDNVCEENLNWSNEPVDKTSLWINVTEDNFDLWIFGVSMETKDNESSGILWQNCPFLYYDTVEIPSPDNVFSANSETGNGTVLEVSIHGYCNLNNQRVRPAAYTIKYKTHSNNEEEHTYTFPATVGENTIYLGPLIPYTEYSLSMRTETRTRLSDYSQAKIIRTKMIAPGSPPRNVRVDNVTGSSLSISWEPTDNPNGPILGYELMLNNMETQSVNSGVLLYTFTNLNGYENFTILIRTCNGVGCSSYTSVMATTLPRAPEGTELDITVMSENRLLVKIDGPKTPNAPSYYHHVRVTKLFQDDRKLPTFYNLTSNLLELNFSCKDEPKRVLVAVETIGIDDSGMLYEPDVKFSEEKPSAICSISTLEPDMQTIIGGSVGGVFGFIFLCSIALFLWKLCQAYRDYDPKIDPVQINVISKGAHDDKDIFSFANSYEQVSIIGIKATFEKQISVDSGHPASLQSSNSPRDSNTPSDITKYDEDIRDSVNNSSETINSCEVQQGSNNSESTQQGEVVQEVGSTCHYLSPEQLEKMQNVKQESGNKFVDRVVRDSIELKQPETDTVENSLDCSDPNKRLTVSGQVKRPSVVMVDDVPDQIDNEKSNLCYVQIEQVNETEINTDLKKDMVSDLGDISNGTEEQDGNIELEHVKFNLQDTEPVKVNIISQHSVTSTDSKDSGISDPIGSPVTDYITAPCFPVCPQGDISDHSYDHGDTDFESNSSPIVNTQCDISDHNYSNGDTDFGNDKNNHAINTQCDISDHSYGNRETELENGEGNSIINTQHGVITSADHNAEVSGYVQHSSIVLNNNSELTPAVPYISPDADLTNTSSSETDLPLTNDSSDLTLLSKDNECPSNEYLSNKLEYLSNLSEYLPTDHLSNTDKNYIPTEGGNLIVEDLQCKKENEIKNHPNDYVKVDGFKNGIPVHQNSLSENEDTDSPCINQNSDEVLSHVISSNDTDGFDCRDIGYQATENGVHGYQATGNGVHGYQATENGVHGYQATENGVYGYQGTENGFHGYKATENGVHGYQGTENGVHGYQATENGVNGNHGNKSGIFSQGQKKQTSSSIINNKQPSDYIRLDGIEDVER